MAFYDKIWHNGQIVYEAAKKGIEKDIKI